MKEFYGIAYSKSIVDDYGFSSASICGILAEVGSQRISHAEIAKLTHMSTKTVQRNIKRLIQDGFIEVVEKAEPKIPASYRLTYPHKTWNECIADTPLWPEMKNVP